MDKTEVFDEMMEICTDLSKQETFDLISYEEYVERCKNLFDRMNA